MNTTLEVPRRPEEPERENQLSFWNKFFTGFAIFVPPIGCAIAVIYWWGRGVNGFYLILAGILYLITGFGITVGFHRLFTHRSFYAKPWLRVALGIAGSMAMEGALFEWCSRHKHHHEWSDKEEDDHSPYWSGGIIRGFIHAQVGWIFKAKPATEEFCKKYIPHLTADPLMVFVNANFPIWVILSLLIPIGAGALFEHSWYGAWLGFIWGGAARIFLVHHITWSVNSVCHIWGTREYDTNDMSTNNFPCGLIGLGEGYHNNHHMFPYSARHGLKWWQIDASFVFIKLFEKLGAISKVLVPKKGEVADKRLS